MKYPKNELAQLIIASCVSCDIEDVVISPGSRNAPLIIGFTSHPKINTYSVVDERCAAFVALGMSQQIKKPVVLVCTSGSALLNYYPAISEAFYSDIPLVVISADRPDYLIDIGDGQTIRQKNVFENHSLYNANLVSGAFLDNEQVLKTALLTSVNQNGPVHINVPFDEPLYETVDTILELKPIINLRNTTAMDADFLQGYADIWNDASQKIVLVGTHPPDILLQTQLVHLAKDPSVLIFTETTSNLRHQNFINHIDRLIFTLEDKEFEDLKPTILISLGGLVVSKKIKQFLRKHSPKHHWHIHPKKEMDTFHCMTEHFKMTPQLFFGQFLSLTSTTKSLYQKNWLDLGSERKQRHANFLSKVPFSDLKVHDILFTSLPENIDLQLANSSIIRYSQLFDLSSSLSVFCNRGTSGIEGSTSTAIGSAMASEKQTLFITGDISFFYDSNAFWNSYIPKSFRMVLINNKGGGIFKVIPGPSESTASNYFETPHGLSAVHICKMFGIAYQVAYDESQLITCLEDFYKMSDHPKLIEVYTPSELNDSILKAYFNNFK